MMMERQSQALSVTSKPAMQPPTRPQPILPKPDTDTYLQMLEGPVVAVIVGSGARATTYNLPVALLCFHSCFFKNELLRYETLRARAYGNKKRKVSTQDESTVVKVEKVDDEPDAEMIAQCADPEETTIKLPDVDITTFGLFLKYVYTGFYPATVDARPGIPLPMPHTSKPTQHDPSYTPAKASMPPPATINSRQALQGSLPSPLPVAIPNNPRLPTTANGNNRAIVPPSVHAYLLSIRLSAPGFLNQALNHIYYGIGKYFTLTPSLVNYICSHTTPGSTLRKLVLDVLVVHWPSLSTHIVAKHAALNKYWNEVFDTHKDFRHAFTMGLQGSAKVLPVQGYFVSMPISAVATKEEAAEQGVEIVEVRSTQVDTSAAEAAAEVAAAEQCDGSRGEGKK